MGFILKRYTISDENWKDLNELSCIVNQIIFEYGSNCDFIQITPYGITFHVFMNLFELGDELKEEFERTDGI